MSREDQRLMLVGSALTGILAQHLSQEGESGAVHLDAAHYRDDELAGAAMSAVKVADLALEAIGTRIPDKLDVYECLIECWEFIDSMARNKGFTCEIDCVAAKQLLFIQRGK